MNEVVVVPPPEPVMFDIARLSIEGLTLLYLFQVTYVNEPEAELVTIARKELAKHL